MYSYNDQNSKLKLLPMKTVSQPETIVLNNVQVWTKHAYMWGISKSLVLWFDFVICMNVNKTFSILLVSLHFSCKLNSVDSFIFVDTNFSELRKTSYLISWVFFCKNSFDYSDMIKNNTRSSNWRWNDLVVFV